jgi:hypothetical protein
LNRLDDSHIFYVLGHTRPDSMMVAISLPGWHWKVEFMADGSVEVERYESVAGARATRSCSSTVRWRRSCLGLSGMSEVRVRETGDPVPGPWGTAAQFARDAVLSATLPGDYAEIVDRRLS